VDLKELQRSWNGLGEVDPLWAIITWPDKRGNRWDVEEFFETGIKEIEELRVYVQSLGLTMPSRRALDFGCGVGRITQALAPHFAEVCGVDIAPSMIDLARQWNRYAGTCTYIVSDTDDLPLFGDQSFDLIYSTLVLQHMEPRYSKGYLREFLRLLAPNGLLIFQLPAEPVGPAPVPSRDRLKDIVRPLVPGVVLRWYRRARRRGRPESSFLPVPERCRLSRTS
jgi:ubiquinone/menaquinone biosynthesis C-methylase UbiE